MLIYASSVGNKTRAPDLYLASEDGSSNVRITDTPDQCEVNPVLTLDGQRIIFYRFPCRGSGDEWLEDRELWQMQLDGEGEQRLLELKEHETAIPSPTGEDILICANDALWLVKTGEGERTAISLPDGTYRIRGCFGWDADGDVSLLAIELDRGEGGNTAPIFLLDPGEGELTQLTSPGQPLADT